MDQKDVMMENGKRRKRRQLSPEEKWEVFLEVCSQQRSQADAARKWNVDVSTVIRIRRLAKDAALAAFAGSKPGRMPSPEQVELEEALAENGRLSEALKESTLGTQLGSSKHCLLLLRGSRLIIASATGTSIARSGGAIDSATSVTSWPLRSGT